MRCDEENIIFFLKMLFFVKKFLCLLKEYFLRYVFIYFFEDILKDIFIFKSK